MNVLEVAPGQVSILREKAGIIANGVDNVFGADDFGAPKILSKTCSFNLLRRNDRLGMSGGSAAVELFEPNIGGLLLNIDKFDVAPIDSKTKSQIIDTLLVLGYCRGSHHRMIGESKTNVIDPLAYRSLKQVEKSLSKISKKNLNRNDFDQPPFFLGICTH